MAIIVNDSKLQIIFKTDKENLIKPILYWLITSIIFFNSIKNINTFIYYTTISFFLFLCFPIYRMSKRYVIIIDNKTNRIELFIDFLGLKIYKYIFDYNETIELIINYYDSYKDSENDSIIYNILINHYEYKEVIFKINQLKDPLQYKTILDTINYKYKDEKVRIIYQGEVDRSDIDKLKKIT